MSVQQCWQQSDWLLPANKWVSEQLALLSIDTSQKLQEVSGWALGQVYKQTCSQGDFYFKATALLPLFSNEAQVNKKLAKLFVNKVPEVVAINADKQWMLTTDFGGGLPENADKKHWQLAFGEFAKLQIAAIEHTETIKQHGCLSRHANYTLVQLTEYFSDTEIVNHLPEQVTSARVQILAEVEQSIIALEQLAIPNTLVHGDLHIENIASTNNGYLFFDWSDACIAHPFVDGTYIYRMDESEDKQAIIDAYLTPWREMFAKDIVDKAWQLAEIVCYAHQAVTYASMIKHMSVQDTKPIYQSFINAFNRLLKAK